MDRINGQSNYNDRERPPAPCCWVPPCVGWCPGLLETNIFCKLFGKMGISQGEKFRFFCLHIGFVANLLAMVATSYAALSISLQYFLLSNSPMEVVEINEVSGKIFSEPVFFYLGLLGVGIDYPDSPLGPEAVVAYDDLCALEESDAGMIFDSTKDCGSCGSSYFSMNAVISLMVAVTLFFPTFFSQQLRMYSGYDVNCVKNFLSTIGFCIVLLNLNVMLTYFYLCSKETFYEDKTVYFDDYMSPVSEEDAIYEVKYTWTWGWGLIALIAGTGLKVVDLLCNISVPTPKVTRDKTEQEIYETIIYVDSDTEDA
jgi:hypothetical protein